jgi:exosortase/archaeosortase
VFIYNGSFLKVLFVIMYPGVLAFGDPEIIPSFIHGQEHIARLHSGSFLRVTLGVGSWAFLRAVPGLRHFIGVMDADYSVDMQPL